MSTAERIQEKVKRLPEPLQRRVLRFVSALEAGEDPDEAWRRFSLEHALRGLEDEDWSDLTEEALSERWD
ncbi:MAG: hypothetical protein D6708_00675 [Candidatus Dadabacteria bacterium]|nr:MAG: hypothetical protein D6708_00675 [Candidatus Dadabacteria bacterium]